MTEIYEIPIAQFKQRLKLRAVCQKIGNKVGALDTGGKLWIDFYWQGEVQDNVQIGELLQ